MTTSTSSMTYGRYYDIDDILAEDEVFVSCTTLFDFDHLAHLLPATSTVGTSSSSVGERQSILPSNTKIRMPLWAIDKWATLGFVRIAIPRSKYGPNVQNAIRADPSSADLRQLCERYYKVGNAIINLIDNCHDVTRDIGRGKHGGSRGWRREHVAMMTRVESDAVQLRQMLLETFGGERLRRIIDWSLNSFNDDVSDYVRHLTESEQRLFFAAAQSCNARNEWKCHGSRRIPVSSAVLASKMYRGISGARHGTGRTGRIRDASRIDSEGQMNNDEPSFKRIRAS